MDGTNARLYIRLCKVFQCHSAFPAPDTNLNLHNQMLNPLPEPQFLNLQIQNILILPKCADETHILLFAIGSSYRIKITIALSIYH